MFDMLRAERLREFTPNSPALALESYNVAEIKAGDANPLSLKFRVFKVCFDYGCAILAMPIVATIAVMLFLLNPFLNPGPVFFVQDRMGKDGRRFRMFKFRSMIPGNGGTRAPHEKLEEDRIPRLGAFMRKTRIDELPNFINVLRGEMSVIGPRPDAYDHATHFGETVDGYSARHRVKPGITGLAQVQLGYVDEADVVRDKAAWDNIYVKKLCGRLDLYVIWRTFFVMTKAMGR